MPVAPTTDPLALSPQASARPLWRTILTPRWTGLLALAVAIAAVMCVLGVWQLDVYHSKTAAATAKRAEGAPVALQSLFAIDSGLPSKAVGRRVTVTGTWGPAADQIYVSDRRYDNRDGFWVITPVLLDATSTPGASPGVFPSTPASPGTGVSAATAVTPGTGAASNSGGSGRPESVGAVMVVRGWVPTTSDPATKAPTGRVELTGAVAASEAQDSSGDAAKGRVLQSLRIPTIVHLVDYRIYDAFVVLASSTVAPPAPGSTPSSSPASTPSTSTASSTAPIIVPAPSPPTDHAGLRNVAYAFQWWIFAAFTLWMWGRMVLDAHRSADPDQPESGLEPSGTVSA
jgi:cytochrome oxidase assembly protein ShyY1